MRRITSPLLPAVWGAIVLVALAVVVGVVVLIPWHMDEFTQFKALACLNPTQQIYSLHDGCQDFPMWLGPIPVFRAYAYAGSMSAWLFYPFWALSHSLWSTYVYGFVAFVVFIIGLRFSFRLRWSVTPLFLLFFPVTFTIMHDGGPVRLALMVLGWTPYFFTRFMASRSWRGLAWVALTGVLWLLATEDKPFFLYLTPGIVILSIAAWFHTSARARVTWRHTGLLAIFAGVPALLSVALLVVLRTPSGSYLSELRAWVPARSTGAVVASFGNNVVGLFDWRQWLDRVLTPTQGGLLGAYSNTANTVTTVVFVALLTVTLMSLLRSRQNRAGAWWLLAATGLFYVGSSLSGGWTSHHFVFMTVPLMVLVAIWAGRGVQQFLVAAGALFVTSVLILSTTFTATVNPAASPEIATVTQAAVDRAGSDKNVVFVCATWGCVMQSMLLHGDAGPWLWYSAESHESGAGLEDILIHDHKTALVAGNLSVVSRESLSEMYPHSRVARIDTGTTAWGLFEVVPESP